MDDKLKELLKAAYAQWKAGMVMNSSLEHPNEELIVDFIEDRISEDERAVIVEHVASCPICSDLVAAAIRIGVLKEIAPPNDIVDQAKSLMYYELAAGVLEIIAKIKEGFVELVSTTGDVLVGQELVPAPILRSRHITEFKDELTVLRDFQNTRVEVKIANKGGKTFSVAVVARDKVNSQVIKDVRVSLVKDDIELESYLADSGKVVFEHVLLGSYRIEITTLDAAVAWAHIDIGE